MILYFILCMKYSLTIELSSSVAAWNTFLQNHLKYFPSFEATICFTIKYILHVMLKLNILLLNWILKYIPLLNIYAIFLFHYPVYNWFLHVLKYYLLSSWPIKDLRFLGETGWFLLILPVWVHLTSNSIS